MFQLFVLFPETWERRKRGLHSNNNNNHTMIVSHLNGLEGEEGSGKGKKGWHHMTLTSCVMLFTFCRPIKERCLRRPRDARTNSCDWKDKVKGWQTISNASFLISKDVTHFLPSYIMIGTVFHQQPCGQKEKTKGKERDRVAWVSFFFFVPPSFFWLFPRNRDSTLVMMSLFFPVAW